VLCACSSSSDQSNVNTQPGSGGSSGGSTAGTGGVTAAGGNTVAGGAAAMGKGGSNPVATGGAGALGSGGVVGGNGGNVVVGGGGAQSTTGGVTAAGGAAGAAATGGASQGGSGGGSMDDVSRSVGCGMTAPMAGNLSIDVMGTSRDYILALPANYTPTMPYRIIFAWHGLGGSAAQVASNWYGLKSPSANSAIFVAGQGLQTTNSVGTGAGWANMNGQDVAFVKALYAKLQGELCFDQNRVFSVGMSYGGIMSDTLGCQMGDVFRAIAPMSGAGPGFGGRANCVGQVAVWMSNGDNDTVVPTAQEEASRDFWVSANHCQMQPMPVDPSPCMAYQGCDAGNPVTWCEFMGGHTIPPFAGAAIWKFFSQF
jgi:poly(3-hydroxybutyrate) depolymerase